MSSQLGPVIPAFTRWISGGIWILLGVVTWTVNSATREYLWPWFLGVQIFYLLPFIGVLAFSVKAQPFPFLGGLIDFGLIGLSAASVLSAVLSPYRWLSVPLATPYVSLLAWTYLLRWWLINKPHEQHVRQAFFRNQVAAFFAVHSFITLAHWMIVDAALAWRSNGWTTTLPRNEFPFGHSNYTAGFAVLSIPWLFYTAVKASGKKRILWTIATFVALCVIPTTGSRGGVAGVATILILATVVLYIRIQLSSNARWLMIFGAVASMITLVLVNPRLRDLVFHGHWNADSDASNLQRTAMTEAGLLMGTDRPWFGWGPGTVPFVYPLYRIQLSGGVENVLELHNTLVQVWAEIGSLGIFCLVALTLGVLVRFIQWFRSPRNSASPTTDFTAVMGIALIGYATVAITDYQLDLPALIGALACYLAVTCPTQSAVSNDRLYHIVRPLLLSSGTFVTLLLAVNMIPYARSRRFCTQAGDALANGDKTLFVQLNTKVAGILPRDPSPINQISAFLIEERANISDEGTRNTLAANMLQCFRESLRRNEAQEYVHFNLGWLLLELGQPGAAQEFLSGATLVPDKGGVYLGLALALLRDGREHEAAAALALESLNDPAFLTSPWWQIPNITKLRAAADQQLDSFYIILLSRVPSDSKLYREMFYQRSLAHWLSGTVDARELIASANNIERKDFFSGNPSSTLFHSSTFRHYRRERTGYPVLMRTPEMTPPVDLYQVQENELAVTKLSFLFPQKGWVPTPLWSDLINGIAVKGR